MRKVRINSAVLAGSLPSSRDQPDVRIPTGGTLPPSREPGVGAFRRPFVSASKAVSQDLITRQQEKIGQQKGLSKSADKQSHWFPPGVVRMVKTCSDNRSNLAQGRLAIN